MLPVPPTHWKPRNYRLRNTTNTPNNKWKKKKMLPVPPTHWKPRNYRLRNTTNTPKNK